MLVLASSSPQRKILLNDIGLSFRMIPSDYEEVVDSNESPEENAKRFALGKAEDVFQNNLDELVLGVDTLVVISGKITGKAKDRDEAEKIIRSMLNNNVEVISGIALVRKDKIIVESETTIVRFGEMTDKEIENFLESGDWEGKSGAFTIQKHGALYIQGIDGDYYNVVGLPIYRLGKMLKAMGLEFYPAHH